MCSYPVRRCSRRASTAHRVPTTLAACAGITGGRGARCCTMRRTRRARPQRSPRYLRRADGALSAPRDPGTVTPPPRPRRRSAERTTPGPSQSASPCGRAVAVRVVLGFDVVPDVRPGRAAVVIARAAVPDLVARGLAGTPFALAAVPAFAVLLGLAVVVLDQAAVFGVAAAETVLTAALSDLAAVVMALVALFIACMAVDIVLAEEVAFVAAAVILVAAELTLVAADETVRTADAAEAALTEALRVVVDAVARLLAFVVGRRPARLDVLPLVDLVLAALAGLRLAAVRVVVRAGTDLPPSRSITEVLFHTWRRFTHPVTVVAPAQRSQAARK